MNKTQQECADIVFINVSEECHDGQKRSDFGTVGDIIEFFRKNGEGIEVQVASIRNLKELYRK